MENKITTQEIEEITNIIIDLIVNSSLPLETINIVKAFVELLKR